MTTFMLEIFVIIDNRNGEKIGNGIELGGGGGGQANTVFNII